MIYDQYRMNVLGKPANLFKYYNGFIVKMHGNGFDHNKLRLVQYGI